MKRVFLVLIVLLFGLCTVSIADSICQFLPITDLGKQSMTAQGKTTADMQSNLPSAEEIAIPVYPDAFCGATGESNGELSTLTIVSKDSPEKVVAWYQEKLANGWQYTPELAVKEAGQVGLFVNTDKKNISPMDSLKYRQLIVSKVEKPGDTGFVEMMFDVKGVKSMIVMSLKPML
ncbi:hypothetical protein [Geopsychrobacter electrodiphilus]|uniref:hypothetical protein n=1 Tax=Geopsychrobacter electrodiphilus TaxID=225196 RepID=UPI00036B8B62|nr:hypothetical protein [Geopsychrobacter electrodiphilus]